MVTDAEERTSVDTIIEDYKEELSWRVDLLFQDDEVRLKSYIYFDCIQNGKDYSEKEEIYPLREDHYLNVLNFIIRLINNKFATLTERLNAISESIKTDNEYYINYKCDLAQLNGLYNYLIINNSDLDYITFRSLSADTRNPYGFRSVEGKYVRDSLWNHDLAENVNCDISHADYWERYLKWYSNECKGKSITYCCFDLFQVCYAIFDYIIQKKGKNEKIVFRKCKKCGRVFQVSSQFKKYCSEECAEEQSSNKMKNWRSDPINRQGEAMIDMLKKRGKIVDGDDYLCQKEIDEVKVLVKECRRQVKMGTITPEKCLSLLNEKKNELMFNS